MKQVMGLWGTRLFGYNCPGYQSSRNVHENSKETYTIVNIEEEDGATILNSHFHLFCKEIRNLREKAG